MQTYEIRIVNVTDDNDMGTFTVEAEDVATLADILERTANYSDEIELDLDNGEVIAITQNSEYGYNADAYKNRKDFIDGEDAIGGGISTGTFCDALEMALAYRYL